MNTPTELSSLDVSVLEGVSGGAAPAKKSAEQIGIEREAERRRRQNPIVEAGRNCAAGAAQGYATSRGNPAGAVAGCIVNTIMPPKPAY
jgi:hypothetical protein